MIFRSLLAATLIIALAILVWAMPEKSVDAFEEPGEEVSFKDPMDMNARSTLHFG